MASTMTNPTSAATPLSVVIPTLDTRDLVLEALDSVVRECPPETEIIVVDDGSSDGTTDAVLQRRPETIVLRNDRPHGFSAAANRGLDRARGDLLLLLNSDAVLTPGCLPPLLDAFETDPSLGIAGAALRFPDGQPQWSGGRYPTLCWLFALTSGAGSLAPSLPLYRRMKPPGATGTAIDWVTGAAMAIRREAWNELRPLDEGYRFYGQDLDLCRRAADAGWRVSLVPGFVVVHRHGATISRKSGAADGADPRALWSDLLRWVDRHEGHQRARRARRVMLAGARLRIAALKLAGLSTSANRRRAARERRTLYSQAAESLVRWE